MTFSRRSSLLFTFLTLLLMWLLPAGCGGGGGDSAVSRAVKPRLNVAWANRSRDVSGPSAALSARVIIRGANADGSDYVFSIDRPTGTDPITQTYEGPLNLAGNRIYNFAVEFRAQSAAGGDIVGIVTGSVSFSNDDGTGSVTVTNTQNGVTSVVIDPEQAVNVGQSKLLTFRVFNAQNQLVAVTPGSALFTVTAGQDKLTTSSGQINGIAAGDAQVVARVNDVASSATTVHVTAPGSGGNITGRVTDAGGAPLAGVIVSTSDGTNTATATSGSDGTYNLINVPTGQRVVVFALNGRVTAADVAVASGGQVTVNATLQTYDGPAITAPPAIQVNPAEVNQTSGLATLTGSVTNTDSAFAVIIVNGSQSLLALNSDGSFSKAVILFPGQNVILVQATNSAGTSHSDAQTVTNNADFLFRVTLTWNGSGDIDLHTFDPSNEHSWFGNKTIGSGSLDVDNIVSDGPENFTCPSGLRPGRYKVAVNAYSLDPNTPRNAVIQVSSKQNGQIVTRTFGPYTFTRANSDGDYPISVSTDAWWRPIDVIVDDSGNVSVTDPDLSPIADRSVGIKTKARHR